MSISSGPDIAANDGLVFNYDMGNTQKSWKGAPTTNLHPISGFNTWPTQTLHFWNGTSWVVDGTYTDPGVPGPAGTYLGIVRKYTSGALSATWSGNSYAYILKTAPMTAGQSYAMSAYTYLSSDCNIDGMHSSIEGATVSALSGGYVTSYNMSQKGSWQRQGLQGTASGNVNFIIAYPNKVGVTNGVFTGYILVGGAQVEFGTFPTPYTDNSRSTTQAIIDLTGTNTVTTTSLTYASDNTFSYNGVANYLTISTFVNKPTTAITVESWIKPTKSTLTGTIRGASISATNSMYIGIIDSIDGGLTHALHWANQTSINRVYSWNGNVPNNAWSHIVGTYDGTIMRAYLNGVQIFSAAQSGTIPDATYVLGTYGGTLTDGVHNFQGILPTSSIYNRALSAAEVQQNFNALRGRFGI